MQWFRQDATFRCKKCAEENDGGRLFCYGSDIDLICVKMTVVNLMMNSVPGEVAWMNTLTMQHWRSYHIDLQLIAGVWLPILKITKAGDTSFIRKLENVMEDNSEMKTSIQSKQSVNHVIFPQTSVINFTSRKQNYDDTRRNSRDNELL